jgi:hypothetical protein
MQTRSNCAAVLADEVTVTYTVLRIAGWTLYSFANTKGTIPCGRAAYIYQ